MNHVRERTYVTTAAVVVGVEGAGDERTGGEGVGVGDTRGTLTNKNNFSAFN